MTAPFAGTVMYPWLVLLGASAVAAAWHTGVLAVGLELWRLRDKGRQARREYVMSVSALGLAFVLTLVTPFLLTQGALAPRTPGITGAPATESGAAATRPIPHVPVPAAGQPLPVHWDVGSIHALAAWLGLVWCVGVAVGLIRIGGGWLLVAALRRRATVVRTPSLVEEFRRRSEQFGIVPPPLLQSRHVEAPVVVGALTPVVLLPDDVVRLSSDEVVPLLVHELAHITRGDYITNVLQSFLAVMLWCSPGTWFIARRIRESREFCCDDIAVRECASPAAYVHALTTLAALQVTTRRRVASLGVAGPRLIHRVRRQLQEDVMPAFVPLRMALLGVLLAATVVAGPGVFRVAGGSVMAAAQRPAVPPVVDGTVPYSYPQQQAGSALTILSMEPTDDARCGVARIRNDANVPVSAVRFVVVVESPPWTQPVSLVQSDMRPVRIPAGGEQDVEIGLVSAAEATALMGGEPAQVMCALLAVRFANDARWQATLNPSARDHQRALGFIDPQLSRLMLTAPLLSPDGRICLDQHEKWYSPGALIAIEREPGRRARCGDNGRWSEVTRTN